MLILVVSGGSGILVVKIACVDTSGYCSGSGNVVTNTSG